MSLHFHETFAPEKGAIAKLLLFANENPNQPMTKEEISAFTGIPTGKSSGKVVPHIKYASFMGLIEHEHSKDGHLLELSNLGEIVYKEDPYLMEKLTHFLCHYNLVRKGSEAWLWSFIFNECVSQQGRNIPDEDIMQMSKRHFMQTTMNLSPIRTCYSSSKSFGDSQIVNLTDHEWQFKEQPVYRPFKFLYAYQLLHAWERQFSSDTELSLPVIINEMGWGNPYVWSTNSVMEALDLLAGSGFIKINRQLSPVSIIRQASSSEILQRIYSLII